VLYELLAGSRPYRLKSGASITLLEQAIVTAQVERPSVQLGAEAGTERSTTQVKLARRLRGDLDAIVLKALAKAPGDRYRSAEALADDLQRYLSGEPVEAHPDRLAYRLSKFVLRHRTGAAITAGAMLAVAAAVGLLQTRTPTAVPSDVGASIARVSDKSIAVLPFVDMSEKKDQEYFSDGLAEQVLDLLSRIPELRVVARTSAFSFKGKADDIPTIAHKLLVANVLEGSVRKDGNRLRITAQLVRADNGYHMWSETYDRKLDDIFKIQDEIAAAVVQALKVSLLQGSRPTAVRTQNTEAYELYLKARSLGYHASSEADFQKQVEYFQKAVKLDPRFAPAWAFLSGALGALALNFPFHSQDWDAARNAAKTALALDPKLSEAHVAMASILSWRDWNWAEAEEQVQRALLLDPNNAGALGLAGSLASTMGNFDKAIEFSQKSLDLDPLSAGVYYNLARLSLRTGNLADTFSSLRKALALNPGERFAHLTAGLALLEKGDAAAALTEMELESDDTNRQYGRAVAYYALKRTPDADSTLAEYEKKYAADDSYGIAGVHAYRGEIDDAFKWLDRAYRQRDAGCADVTIDPLLKNLRSDPRYKEFLRKMKLPE
jgi:TolB-like protein